MMQSTLGHFRHRKPCSTRRTNKDECKPRSTTSNTCHMMTKSEMLVLLTCTTVSWDKVCRIQDKNKPLILCFIPIDVIAGILAAKSWDVGEKAGEWEAESIEESDSKPNPLGKTAVVSSTIQAHKSISWYLDVDMVCIIPSWQLWLESFEGRVSTPQKTTTFIHYNCIIQMHLHKQYRESRLQASLHTPLLIMCLLDIDEGSSFVDRLSPEKDFSSKSASILKSALTYTLCEL